MIIDGHIYGPSPLLKLLAPPGLPPIDHFYCSPLKRWVLGCKQFVPSDDFSRPTCFIKSADFMMAAWHGSEQIIKNFKDEK